MQTESDTQVWQVPIKSNTSQKNAVCAPTGGEVVYAEERSRVPLWTTLPLHPVCSHWTSLPKCLADSCAVSTVCVGSLLTRLTMYSFFMSSEKDMACHGARFARGNAASLQLKPYSQGYRPLPTNLPATGRQRGEVEPAVRSSAFSGEAGAGP